MYSNEEMTPLKDSHLKLKDATVKIHVQASLRVMVQAYLIKKFLSLTHGLEQV